MTRRRSGRQHQVRVQPTVEIECTHRGCSATTRVVESLAAQVAEHYRCRRHYRGTDAPRREERE